MAASDPQTRHDRPAGDAGASAPAEMRERLHEEISRAERHRTALSCLLVEFDNLEDIAREHGEQLREQTLDYVLAALRRELRPFDRVGRGSQSHLLVILPGADSARGEIVARRALQRLRTIKVESGGQRLPLHVSVGLAAWRPDVDARELLAQARVALEGARNAGAHTPLAGASPPPPRRPARAAAPGTGRAAGH